MHSFRLRALIKYTKIAQASFDYLPVIERCVSKIKALGLGLVAFKYLDLEMLACCKHYDCKVELVLAKQVFLFKCVKAVCGGCQDGELNEELRCILYLLFFLSYILPYYNR